MHKMSRYSTAQLKKKNHFIFMSLNVSCAAMNACLLCCNCCHSTGIYGFEMKWLFQCDVNVITSALTGTWVKIYSLT